MRTFWFWAWFLIATAALARLWSTIDSGGLFVRFTATDGIALVVLLVAGFVLGRVQYRTARAARDAKAHPIPESETKAEIKGGT